jgi:hypothetical protein
MFLNFYLEICLCILFIDIFFKHIYIIHSLARWYLIHAIVNFIITGMLIGPIYDIIKNPLKEIFHPIVYYDSTIVIDILHIYHMLFFSCTKADIFHHLFFVVIGSIFVFLFNNGKFIALSHLFLCGLPGGIDYVILFLYQFNYVTKFTRLKIATFLNIWIRAPGLCIISTVGLLYYLENEKTLYSTVQLFFQIIMSYGNGQYYLRDTVFAYGKHSVLNSE